MAKTPPAVPNQVNVITLQCARDWHKAFKDHIKKGLRKGDLPSSIVVPFANIEQIVNDFKKEAAPTINGVRLYFIIKPKTPKGRTKVTVMLVPTKVRRGKVEWSYEDMVVPAIPKPGAPRSADCVGGNNPSSSRRTIAATSHEDDYVSVYDFTRPCPPFCDPESPING